MLDRLRALDTCAVSDALDTLNLAGATTGIRPLWAVAEPVVGRVLVVYPGDVVLADANGVVFIQADQLDRVIALAERIVAREQRMAEAVGAGQPVTEVMHDSRFPTVEEAAG